MAIKPSLGLKEICLEFGHVAKHLISFRKFRFAQKKRNRIREGLKRIRCISSSIQARKGKFLSRIPVRVVRRQRRFQPIVAVRATSQSSYNYSRPGDAYFINYQPELSPTNYRFAVRRLTTNEGRNSAT